MEGREKLKRENNNMDAIRYVMAFSVVVAHFNELCGFRIYWPISSATGVGGFFALSGFLIFHSFQRHPQLGRFLAKRGRRILPPYFMVVIICAFLLVFASTLPAAEYFLSSGWWAYVAANLSFLNFLAPSLPGVFDTPEFVMPAVNGSLWTMKVEWCLYLTVPVVAWILTRFSRRCRPTPVFTAIIFFSIAYSLFFHYLYDTTGNPTFNLLARQFFAQLSFFYVGVLAFHHLDFLLRNRWLVLVLLLGGLCLMQIHPYVCLAIRPVVEGGLVLWLSLVGRWGRYVSQHDNVSYDIYLFHFPIIQTAILLGIPAWGQWPAFAVICATVTLVSFLSWNLVGKRFRKF